MLHANPTSLLKNLRHLCCLGVILAILPSCASSTFQERDRIARGLTSLQKHWSATTIEDAMAPLSDRFRGNGGRAPAPSLESRVLGTGIRTATASNRDRATPESLTRAKYREELLWQLALHRTLEPSEIQYSADRISATLTLTNDLSRLLDHPGWEWRIEYAVEGNGQIRSASARPEGPPAPLRNWLSPAIPWLRKHRSADLDWLLTDGGWNRSPRAAERWIEVLTEWRASTGRRPLR